jgi:plastocyanin
VTFSTTSGSHPPGAIVEVLRFPSFSQPSVTAKAGTVVFYLVNAESPRAPGHNEHNMVVYPSGSIDSIASSDRVGPGKTAIFTIKDLPAGSYSFYCTLLNHSSAGMKGTLTITA